MGHDLRHLLTVLDKPNFISSLKILHLEARCELFLTKESREQCPMQFLKHLSKFYCFTLLVLSTMNYSLVLLPLSTLQSRTGLSRRSSEDVPRCCAPPPSATIDLRACTLFVVENESDSSLNTNTMCSTSFTSTWPFPTCAWFTLRLNITNGRGA